MNLSKGRGAGSMLSYVDFEDRVTRSGVTTRHVYHAAGNLLAEVNASGPIQKYFIYARGLAGKVTNTGTVPHVAGLTRCFVN